MTACYKAKTNLLYLLPLIVIIFAASCRKSEDTAGANIVGPRNPFDMVYSDTTGLVCYTTIADSIATKNLSAYLLGNINDPVLGESQANIFTNVSLPVNQFSFGQGFTGIDSIVMQITYASPTAFSGKLASLQSIKLYEMDEQLLSASDSPYFSTRPYKYLSSSIGEYSGSFSNIADSVKININNQTISYAPHLRIKITDNNFIQRFANGESSGLFLDNTNFQKTLKGFAMIASASPASGDGCIAYMLMNTSTTALVIYYNGNKTVDFPLTVNTTRTNQFVHNRSTSIPVKLPFALQHENTNYLQSMTGLKTRVMLPNLFDLVKNNHVAISGAELEVSIKDGSFDANFPLPKSLMLSGSDSTGINTAIVDYGTSGSPGVFDASTNTYRFNLTRHIQLILNQYKENNRNFNYGLNIIVPAEPTSGSRAILDTSPGKIKLKLTYSVIK